MHGTIHFTDDPARRIDDGLCLIFKAPGSYTGEDSAEIQCHGGTSCSRQILQAMINAGARQAEPGEFTKRAFLNGKMDLLQAEAVADLIHAQSDRAAASALRQLEGDTSTWYRATYDIIISAAGLYEASLDFSEEELPSSIYKESTSQIMSAIERLRDALSTWNDGRLLQEGARVAIAGRPNAGKSSLFNALLGYDRVIVTPIPGTTRDTVEDFIITNGLVIRLIDTAGLRQTTCDIESQGISRAHKAVKSSDITLYVIDTSTYDPDDLIELKKLEPSRSIIVLNKSDLAPKGIFNPPQAISHCFCSCTTKTGISELKSLIISHLDGFHASQLNSMNQRHRSACEKALEQLQEAIILTQSDPEQNAALIAAHLRSAAISIGEITGAEYHNDLLDNIFGRFCIGK